MRNDPPGYQWAQVQESSHQALESVGYPNTRSHPIQMSHQVMVGMPSG